MSADARRAFSRQVAHKLHFAGLCLQRAEAADTAARREALESALFHLAGAYGAFVAEVLAVAGGVRFGDYHDVMQYVEHVPASASPELERLRLAGAGGWLGEMLDAWRGLARVQVMREPKSFDAPVQAIPVLQLAADAVPELAQVMVWRRELSGLFDELRESLAEW